MKGVLFVVFCVVIGIGMAAIVPVRADAPASQFSCTVAQLQAIGNRAGVRNVHPHRFRHTFAISFLRNGGNGYTLQMILGHTTMEMVRKYLNLAQADLESAHRLASPVANWRL